MKELERGMAEGGPTKALEYASNVMEKRMTDSNAFKERTMSLREKALETNKQFRIKSALDDAKNSNEYKEKVAAGDTTGALQVLAQAAETADPTLMDRLDKMRVDPSHVSRTVDAVLGYRMDGKPFTGGRGLGNTPFGRAVADEVSKHPEYDETMFAATKKLRSDLATGQTGNRLASLTMLMGHMKTLEGLVKSLPADADYKTINQIYNKFAQQYNVDLTKYDTAADAVSHEFSTVLAGAKGSTALSDREEAAVHFNRDFNKGQILGNLETARELVRSRIVSDITRAAPFIDIRPYLPPEVQQYFGLEIRGKGEKPPPEPPADDSGVQKTSLQDIGGGAQAKPLGGGDMSHIPQEVKDQAPAGWDSSVPPKTLNGKPIYAVKKPDGYRWEFQDGSPAK